MILTLKKHEGKAGWKIQGLEIKAENGRLEIPAQDPPTTKDRAIIDQFVAAGWTPPDDYEIKPPPRVVEQDPAPKKFVSAIVVHPDAAGPNPVREGMNFQIKAPDGMILEAENGRVLVDSEAHYNWLLRNGYGTYDREYEEDPIPEPAKEPVTYPDEPEPE